MNNSSSKSLWKCNFPIHFPAKESKRRHLKYQIFGYSIMKPGFPRIVEMTNSKNNSNDKLWKTQAINYNTLYSTNELHAVYVEQYSLIPAKEGNTVC